jgi:hypothetical protein
VTITQPDTTEVSTEVNRYVHGASALVVGTQEAHEAGEGLLKDLAFAQKNVEHIFKPMKDAAFKAHREITGAERKLIEPIKTARKIVSDKLVTYEEAAKAAAIQAAHEEQERLRKQEEDEALALAESIAADAPDEAEAILEAVAEAPAPVVIPKPELTKTEGVSSSVTYKCEITSPILLLRHIVANPALTHLVKAFDQQKLNSMANASREAFDVAGCKAVKHVSKRVRL